jgi:hypothetical protein
MTNHVNLFSCQIAYLRLVIIYGKYEYTHGHAAEIREFAEKSHPWVTLTIKTATRCYFINREPVWLFVFLEPRRK